MRGVSDSNYGDFKHRRQEGVWHHLNRVMTALIVFAVTIIIACAFLPELKKQRDEAAKVEQLKADTEKQKELLAKRTREVDLLKNDPGYVETIARDRLDLMKERETIFRIETQPAPDKSNMKLNH